MDYLHISSPANPRFKYARTLLNRRARTKEDKLLLEGARLIEDSISAGYPPALVFFEPEQEKRLEALLGTARDAGAEVLSLETGLFAQLSETVTSQGIVAVSSRPQVSPGSKGLSLIVDGVRDPGNLGTLVRTAAAVGADAICTLPGVTDIWAPKTMRAGMGAHYRVAIRQARDFDQIQDWLGDIQYWVAEASALHSYSDVDLTPPGALIVGGETTGTGVFGLRADIRPIRIPMAASVESLNVAVAASVILFEAARQRSTRPA